MVDAKLEMLKTLEIFKTDEVDGKNIIKRDSLIEVRAVGKKPKSGYFMSREKAVEEVLKYPKETWYFVLNQIESDCYARLQRDCVHENPKSCTADHNITARHWILIDADPIRTSDTSASDDEKRTALMTMAKIHDYLEDVGFASPVVCDSGNGYHLLYKIQLENKNENTELIKQFIEVLNMLFGDEKVSIDTSVFNASRITKLYGSWARKGSNTPDRPHRQSRIMRVPDEIKSTSKLLIQKVADILPKPEKPTYRNNYTAFDLRGFISQHGIGIAKETNSKDVTKFVLDECVFNPNHKAPDAAFFELSNGAIAYKCLHASCSDYRWQDVRQKFDPNCYEKTEAPQHRDSKPLPPVNVPTSEQVKSKDDEYHFIRVADIKAKDRSKIVVVKTGLAPIDEKIGGANLGEVSVWSGGNGSAKTTILSQVALDARQAGFNVAMFSGELTDTRVKNWMHLQAAGRQYTMKLGNLDAYYVPSEYEAPIDKWLGDKMWLYLNDYGTEFKNLIGDIIKHIEKYQSDIIIIDNLTIIDTSQIDGFSTNDKQKYIIDSLHTMAQRYNVHVHFVCHPRKQMGFLRKEDICGTGDITNIADNVFMCHRVNRDFNNRATEFYGKDEIKKLNDAGVTNVIEIMKNRDLGKENILIGLYFEVESKRLLSERFGTKYYRWQELMDKPKKWENVDNLEGVF